MRSCPERIVIGLLLLIGMWGASGAQTGPSAVGVKPAPLGEVVRRARFHVLVPKSLDNAYRLVSAQIAWVPKDRFLPNAPPARQAVCLTFTINGKKATAGVEVPSRRGADRKYPFATDENIY